MKFNFVALKNFKRFGDYETRLDLNINETRLLIGENGNGKTSFIDAIIWGLYGRSICAIDEVVNRQIKKDCKVEINLDVGTDNYSIIRYRNHTEHGNKLLVFKNRENISRRTMNDTQDLIDEIIQIQYNAMVSSILYSSELYISFLRAKITDRLKIIESILSLKEIQEYYESVREMRKPISDKIGELILNKEKINSEVSANAKSIIEYKENIKKKLTELKNQKDILVEQIKKIKTDIEVASHIDFTKEIEANKLFEEVTLKNKELFNEIEKEKKNLIDTHSVMREIERYRQELDEISHIDVEFELENINLHKEIEKHNLDIDNEILKLRNKIFDIREKEKLVGFHSGEIEEVQKEIDKMRKNTEKCITCGQKVTQEFTISLIEKREKEISILKEEEEKLRRDIKSITGNNEKLYEEIEKLKRRHKELPTPSKFSEKYLSDLGKNKEYLHNQAKLVENSFEEKEKFNVTIDLRIKNLKEGLSRDIPPKSQYDNNYLEWLKNSATEQQIKIDNFEKEILLINERAKTIYDKKFIEGIEKRIKNLEKDIKKNTKEIEVLKIEDFHYEVMQQLFSNRSSGIKKYIIDKMLDLFNEKVNFYLPFFFDEEISITFDKDLNEVITIDKNPLSFATFSSGEKTRFELAIAFSLFMLVKTFFSTTINLLVFDEILDQNLDKKGVKAVLDIIDNLGQDNSVLVISHREEMKEYFVNQVSIIRENGFSKIA
jgi:DNA repair exonuclease SbcCD ATPase subunit